MNALAAPDVIRLLKPKRLSWGGNVFDVTEEKIIVAEILAAARASVLCSPPRMTALPADTDTPMTVAQFID